MPIEARLARLERSNRRLRAGLALALALLAAAPFLGAARQPAEVLRAQRLEIVDADGNALVVLGGEGGGGVVALSHPSGAGLRLGAAGRAGEIAVFNAAGQTTVNFSASPDGRGTVETFDGGGHRLVALTSTDDGAGALVVRAKDGSVLASLTAADGVGRLRTLSPTGTELAAFGATRSGGGMFQLNDADGNRAVALAASNGRGVVLTSTADGRTTGTLGVDR